MKLTAIIALNLAVLRLVPEMRIGFPTSVFAIVMINLLLVQTVALGRRLRAFHYTFLIVGFISTGVIIALVFTISRPVPGSLAFWRPRSSITGLSEGKSGHFAAHRVPDAPHSRGVASVPTGVLPAWAAAVLASWSMADGSGSRAMASDRGGVPQRGADWLRLLLPGGDPCLFFLRSLAPRPANSQSRMVCSVGVPGNLAAPRWHGGSDIASAQVEET